MERKEIKKAQSEIWSEENVRESMSSQIDAMDIVLLSFVYDLMKVGPGEFDPGTTLTLTLTSNNGMSVTRVVDLSKM